MNGPLLYSVKPHCQTVTGFSLLSTEFPGQRSLSFKCKTDSDCPCGSERFYCNKKRKSCVFKCGDLCGSRSCWFIDDKSCIFGAKNVFCACRINFWGITECQAPTVSGNKDEINMHVTSFYSIPYCRIRLPFHLKRDKHLV